MPIGALVTMTAKPGAAAELLALVQQAVRDSRTEPGNLMVLSMTDPDDDHKIRIFEIYRDQAAIEAHKAEPHTTASAPRIHALFGAPIEVKKFDTTDWPADIRVNNLLP